MSICCLQYGGGNIPYIDKPKRRAYDKGLQEFPIPLDPGDLNYVMTKLMMMYLSQYQESYRSYNEVVGVLECCKLEFYRRQIARFENDKILSNGDVFLGPLSGV